MLSHCVVRKDVDMHRYEDAKLSGITVRHKLKYKGVGVDRKVEANFGILNIEGGGGGLR